MFSSVYVAGELRGCIGTLQAREPLAMAAARYAVEAAANDRRFAPVRSSELADVELTVCILSPPSRIVSPADLVLGRHGVIVRERDRLGVLLPGVGAREGWDPAAFVAAAAAKGGIDATALPRASLERFEASEFRFSYAATTTL